MPRDGSGTYTQPSGTTAVTGTPITSSDYNTLNSDIGSEITGSLPRNGVAAMTADLQMGGNKIEVGGDATAATDFPVSRQIAEGEFSWIGAIADGGTDAYAAGTNGFAPSAYVTGMKVRGIMGDANTTTTPTLNYASLGAKDIHTDAAGTAPVVGAWAANDVVEFTYNGTHWVYSVLRLPSLSDDTSPQLSAPLDTNSHQVRLSKGADIASASTLTLGSDGNIFDVTGTTGITGIASVDGNPVVKFHFTGALLLTHHATDFIMVGGENITTTAGDQAEFVQYASGQWRMTNYARVAGQLSIIPDVHIKRLESSGVDGGGTSSATWTTVPLNTVSRDPFSHASLSSNQVTLDAGTYWAEMYSTILRFNSCRVRLRNTTDGTNSLVGTSQWVSNSVGDTTSLEACGEFTVGASKSLEMQVYSEASTSTQGLGVALGIGDDELYAELKLWKMY